jgi:serine protease Do
MKKFRKGLILLSAGLVLLTAGCSCYNDEDENQNEETNHDSAANYDDFKNSLSGLYEENVKTTVVVEAFNKAGNRSLGTGFVYREEGGTAYILTNAHVLVSKDGNGDVNYYTNKIEVVYSNYERQRVSLAGYDRNEDVAVLMVSANTNYKVAKIVNDDYSTNVGDAVFAIGHPHDQRFSLTEGVISGTKIKTSLDYIAVNASTKTFVYNSTATINAGNSGGPLFNANGEVVAINTMYPNDTGANTPHRNFNYSIPVRHCVDVADHLVGSPNENSYKRAVLNLTGKSISSYDTTAAANANITVKRGVHVTSSSYVEIPADIKVITAVDGVEIATIEELEYAIFTKKSSDTTVTLTICDKTGSTGKQQIITLSR